MKVKIALILSGIAFGVFLSSCGRYATEKDFDGIALYMNKQDVIEKMSANGIARGSIINKYGQQIEVREYEVKVFRPWIGTNVDSYWLYFCNGKLVQWGMAGDWAEAQRVVYDINFNSTSS